MNSRTSAGNALAFRDNRSTWHFAVNDYHAEPAFCMASRFVGQKLN
ncbi:MAG: hypothetical protein JO320_14930 [Alphaproteobacteria bacterium]|nr:hypothetical protein [Alphaproteobacteria bacterium]MBV9376329.1 hypothetical protein [Alphaproteobacteria bacterium]